MNPPLSAGHLELLQVSYPEMYLNKPDFQDIQTHPNECFFTLWHNQVITGCT